MSTPQRGLDEKNFIDNEPRKWNIPIWIWFFLALLFCGLLLQFFLWMWRGKPATSAPPFYQVTNREMSLFLWQNQGFMKRSHPEAKRYLPSFDTQDGVALEEGQADQLALGPPELFFRYHTWNRLLQDEFTNGPIPVDEFLKFLTYAKEWLPENWPSAPEEYIKMIPQLPQRRITDLSKLPDNVLPVEVRMAFQGWQDYFLKSREIAMMQPTREEIVKFIANHPHYARNYWRNIERDYLASYAGSGEIPVNEIPLFLKQAMYNASRPKEK